MTLLLLGLAVLCKLKETNSISGGWFWSLAVALTAFGVLTYSKTFFLVFILLGGVYIIWQFWSRKVFRGVFFSAAAVLLAAYMLLSKNSPFAIVIERLTGGDSLSDFTTGRSELFVQYWNVITQNVSSVLFGLGLDAPILGKGTHNLFLEVLYFSGVVGLLLMTALYVGLVRDIQKGNREIKGQSLIAKHAALLIMVVQYMTLQGMFQVVTYAGLFIAILSIYIHPRKLHENQKQNTGEVVEVYDLLGSQTKNQ
jgi:O-antigen ligase